MIKIIECPRDAMQGITRFIPTKQKAAYINALLKVGFDTVDFGSFVSPRAIPQMKDTGEVLKLIDMPNAKSKLLAIVANTIGGQLASQYDEITYLGFPFSISPTFLRKNINSTIARSIVTVNRLLDICERHHKILVVYISMAFGNPYGDKWSTEMVLEWVDILVKLGVKIIALSDTTGDSVPETIYSCFSETIPRYHGVEFGLHLHTTPATWREKVEAAFNAGCRRFDTVLNGMGGCPMSGKEMIANLKTSDLFQFLEEKKCKCDIDIKAFQLAYKEALKTFPHHFTEFRMPAKES